MTIFAEGKKGKRRRRHQGRASTVHQPSPPPGNSTPFALFTPCFNIIMSSENDEEDIASSSEQGSNYSDADEDDEDDDDSYSDESDSSSRTLLFLCEEGQLDRALERVKSWDDQYPPGSTASADTMDKAESAADRSSIRRQILQKSHGGNYCLHEILAGGTSGRSAPDLVQRLVRRCMEDYPVESQRIFRAQPKGSHCRTLLHWCAWCKTSPAILRPIMMAYPEAMCLRDDKSHGRRTPLDIAERYWKDDPITGLLRSSLETYLPFRLRFCLHSCIYRHFVTDRRTPFDRADRKETGLTPRAWFVASIIGFALQREMKSLANNIISFVGRGAKIDGMRSAPKRKRKERQYLEQS